MSPYLANPVKRFFSHYLPVQKGLATNTVLAYRTCHTAARYSRPRTTASYSGGPCRETWVDTVLNFGRWFKRATGRAESLTAEAARRGRHWLHGLAHSRAAFG